VKGVPTTFPAGPSSDTIASWPSTALDNASASVRSPRIIYMAYDQQMHTIQRQLAYLEVWVTGNGCGKFGGSPSIYSHSMITFQCCVNCQNTCGPCSTQYENLLAISSRHAVMIVLRE
jgi:hypothetical protein